MLSVGEQIKDFSALDQNQTIHTQADMLGHWSVLYFYPKDDTPGCTKEACGIAEVYSDFTTQGVNVYGVSKDSPESHKLFADKYSLPFTLLSDPEMNIISDFGAYTEKTVNDELVRSTKRVTFLINPDGIIAKVYPDVDPANHAVELLKDISSLQSA